VGLFAISQKERGQTMKTFTLDSPTEIIDELTYVNYRHNRRISPHVKAEDWRKVYGLAADRMEVRFQMEARG